MIVNRSLIVTILPKTVDSKLTTERMKLIQAWNVIVQHFREKCIYIFYDWKRAKWQSYSVVKVEYVYVYITQVCVFHDCLIQYIELVSV